MAKEAKASVTYPRSVYHKDFDHLNAHEGTLKTHSRYVKDEEAHKKLGPDWQPGLHPSHVAKKVEEKPVVEKVVEESVEVVEEEPKKGKWGK